MGHVGDIGGGGRRGRGDGTRVGRAPTAEGNPSADAADTLPGRGSGRTGERPAYRTGERPAMGTGERPAYRTGERPAMGTGERPALRTGERPAYRTGERPALNDRGQSPRTGSRPALPAATFADALTDSQAGRVSSGAETLVMPKVELPPESARMTRGGKTREMPALKDGKASTNPDSSPETPEGRTVNDMDTPIGRGGGTRIVRMPEALGGRGRAEGAEGGPPSRPGKGADTPAPTPRRDGFGTAPTTSNRPALGTGEVKGPVLPVEQLIPEGLDELGDLEAVAKRFASDGALLHQQIRPSDLPSTDRAVRLWAFFTAYAEAAAGKDGQGDAQQIFDKALKEQGFGEYRDARTGDDGAKAARWVLQSGSPEEARERADQVELEPPPEVLLSEAARSQEGAKGTQPQEAARRPDEPPPQSQALKDSAFSQGPERAPLERMPGQSEFVRVNPQLADMPKAVILPQNPDQLRRSDDDSPVSRFDDLMKKLNGNMRLGSNMLWNLLHRSRNGPEDSAIEKEKWNQLVFAAIIAFVGLMIVIMMVVAL
ncbi:hypothetical protein [Hyalangium gracile]|uniref:hypothetical protein n=1 Tax=Hyalangium gracile TaxID=394092 RepID=UPI001CC9CA16|nr:hypothetical protein [Hyalangium gracile]